MRRIMKLSPEQLADLDKYAKAWADTFCSPGPGDRAIAEQAVIAAYLQAGVEPPEKIIWYASPLQALMAMLHMEEILSGIPADIGPKDNRHGEYSFTINYVVDETYYYVVQYAREGVYCNAKERLAVDVLDTIIERYYDAMGGYRCLNRNLKDAIGNIVKGFSPKKWRNFCDRNGELVAPFIRPVALRYEEGESGWFRIDSAFHEGGGPGVFSKFIVGIYGYLLEALGFDECLPYLPNIEIAKHCSWWLPLEKIAFMADKHVFMSRDQRGAPHNVGGMALRYRDGFGLYAVHGEIVPAKWGRLPAHQWEASWIDETHDTYCKHAISQVIGYERMLNELESVLVHESNGMELHCLAHIDWWRWLLLKVTCPLTGKTTIVRVPPHIKNCEQARRWAVDHDELAIAGAA